MKIGYLGPESSFTHQAAKKISGELVAFSSIPDCLKAVLKDDVHAAIVPIENSLEGSVHSTIDILSQEPDLTVNSEIILPIQQQFLINEREDITMIFSHPQALAQSRNFIETHYPQAQLMPMPSTTAAAEYVANHPEEAVAAIASKETAQHFQLRTLAENIQDNPWNQTRFWLISKEKEEGKVPEKMSLILTLPSNKPGMLHKMLAAFGWREINLSKIESRPLKTSLGEYFFVIDLLLDRPIQLVYHAIAEIELLGGEIHLLGSYPVKTYA
ncbi:prephenate dehydratase [Enterococcus mediterraneensis]|uniref:prephenate dehydratase n=1 Tax=Enterococcus mediterraneensis TaxID=2364791 RepID=UPI000F048AEE|nr:prephenate dehydratase [Enterococcus mediterraneensis]